MNNCHVYHKPSLWKWQMLGWVFLLGPLEGHLQAWNPDFDRYSWTYVSFQLWRNDLYMSPNKKNISKEVPRDKLLEIANTSLHTPSKVCLARLALLEAVTAASSSLLDMPPGQGGSMAERQPKIIDHSLLLWGQLLLDRGSTSCSWAKVAKYIPRSPSSYIAVDSSCVLEGSCKRFLMSN